MDKWTELWRRAVEDTLKKNDFRVLLTDMEETLRELQKLRIISSNWLLTKEPGYRISLADESNGYYIYGYFEDAEQFEIRKRNGNLDLLVRDFTDLELQILHDLMNSFDVRTMLQEVDGWGRNSEN